MAWFWGKRETGYNRLEIPMSDAQWKVPLSDIDLGEPEIQAVEAVLRSRWLSMGGITANFELTCAEYLHSPYTFAVANGTAALHLACLALELGPGDEVILPSLTFVASANAVLYTGATPVFADIHSLSDLTISPAQVESLVTPRTRAIMVMHYGGYLCAMSAIQEIATRHRLAIIEDAAHAPGAALDGRKAGTLSDIGCFSFFANKNLVTGEGGLVVTARPELAEKIRRLRSHGMTSLTWDRHRGHASSYDVTALGYNYRMDEIHSALGAVQLEKLDANNQRRALVSQRYRQSWSKLPYLCLPFGEARGNPAYHLFVVLLNQQEQRGDFIAHLRAAGVQTSLHYPPIHRFSYYQNRFGNSAALPLTEDAASRLVTLPLYPTLSDEQIETVITAVQSFQP